MLISNVKVFNQFLTSSSLKTEALQTDRCNVSGIKRGFSFTFFVLGYLCPGEVWGGLAVASGTWVGGASVSGTAPVSPSCVSAISCVSRASPGDAGGGSEQALAVRVRRLCCPMCVRFREKLFLCLFRLTFAAFWAASSFTGSNNGWTSKTQPQAESE